MAQLEREEAAAMSGRDSGRGGGDGGELGGCGSSTDISAVAPTPTSSVASAVITQRALHRPFEDNNSTPPPAATQTTLARSSLHHLLLHHHHHQLSASAARFHNVAAAAAVAGPRSSSRCTGVDATTGALMLRRDVTMTSPHAAAAASAGRPFASMTSSAVTSAGDADADSACNNSNNNNNNNNNGNNNNGSATAPIHAHGLHGTSSQHREPALCRCNRHSAGSTGWPFTALKYKYICQI